MSLMTNIEKKSTNAFSLTINSENPMFKLLKYYNKEHYKKTGKRYWDLCSAVIISLFLWPLFVILAIIIKLDSKGPVIYSQKRIGQNGKIFEVYKFRTMVQGAEELSFTTSDDDPRITRVGKIIRPISLDELPQLINIIKGDMSFIGPRPLSEEEYNSIVSLKEFPEKLCQDLLPTVRPGILGWAIFYGREKISYEDRCRLNKEYEEKISLLFDSYISWLTLKKYWISYLVVISLFLVIPLTLLKLL